MDGREHPATVTFKQPIICLTELSTVALVAWALGLSAVLWLAILAVL